MLVRTRKLATIAAVAALSALSLAVPATAETTPSSFNAEQLGELHANMDDLGIDAQTQEALIDKLESGETVDALDPAAVPVSTIQDDTAKFESEIRVYEDGSRARSSVENPKSSAGGISPQSITQCKTSTFSGGSHLSNCLIKIEVITHTAQFRASYTLVNGGNSYISSAYNWGCVGLGCTIETTGIVKKTADLNGPAKASMRVRIAAGPFATTGYAQLFVKGAKAWTN
ncbi:hypothetical protein GCM10028787_32970 [Brachybacterium horti]|uniref:Uncharacterized protein n=1 Tax=Brachybacterium rhamnosum TaxID=173361 RepID=A0ABW4Q2M1_9MICO